MDLIVNILNSVGGAFAFVGALLLLAFWAVRKLTEWQCEMNASKDKTSKLEGNIDDIKADISYIKGTLDMLKNNMSDALVKSHSPISLTEKGKQIATSMGVAEMIATNWDKICTCIERNVPNSNAYDIQQFCVETATISLGNFFNEEDVVKIKDFAFRAGQNIAYYGGMIGVLIRDKYFEIKHISIEDVDKNDPNKVK